MKQTYFVLLETNDLYDAGVSDNRIIGIFERQTIAYRVMNALFQNQLIELFEAEENNPDYLDTSSYHIDKRGAFIQTNESEPDIYRWEIVEGTVISSNNEAELLLEGELLNE
mgnify:CR=1 FL=1